MVAQTFGWVGFAADIFGAEYEGTGPSDFTLLRMLRNEQPQIFMDRIHAAVQVVANVSVVDPTKIALAGYCFGGSGYVFPCCGGIEYSQLNPLYCLESSAS